MAKRRPSGDGMVRKRDDGRWEGRIVVGHKENGDSIFHYVYAPTQKELSTKLRQNIDAYQGVDLTEDSSMTLCEWLDRWLDKYMAGTVRPSEEAGPHPQTQKIRTPVVRQHGTLYPRPALRGDGRSGATSADPQESGHGRHCPQAKATAQANPQR